MFDALRIAMLALSGFGGAALGVAAGGFGAMLMRWRGARMAAAVAPTALVGLCAGLLFSSGDGSIAGSARAAAAPVPDAVWNLDVIQKYYPADYAKIAATLNDHRGADASELRKATSIDYSKLVLRQTSLVNADNALAMMKLERDEVVVAERTPGLCDTMADPSIQAVDPESIWPTELSRRDKDLDRQVLLQTATAPVAPGDLDSFRPAVTRTMLRALRSLPRHDQAVLIPILSSQGAPASGDEIAAYCRFTERIYDETLALGAAQRLGVYKSMMFAGYQRRFSGQS
jgi:hypothetical protein